VKKRKMMRMTRMMMGKVNAYSFNYSETNSNTIHVTVPLLDQPLEMSGRRDRRKTQRFTEELDKSTEIRSPTVVTVPPGQGTPLGEIPFIEENIKKIDSEILKALYRTMYGRFGKASTFRRYVRLFHGFDFTKTSEQFEKKRATLAK
jgi:hypothetical protein